MIELYPDIKLVHIAAVLASGALFLVRGVAVQAGGRWAMTPSLRYLSYGIDTVLLTAAVMLLAILPATLYANGWLTLKMALLVAYVVLGSYALKRGRTARARAFCFVAAVLLYAAMLAIARTHSPLGPWLVLKGWLA